MKSNASLSDGCSLQNSIAETINQAGRELLQRLAPFDIMGAQLRDYLNPTRYDITVIFEEVVSGGGSQLSPPLYHEERNASLSDSPDVVLFGKN